MRWLAAWMICAAVYPLGLNGYRYMSMLTAGVTKAVIRPLAAPTTPPAAQTQPASGRPAALALTAAVAVVMPAP